MTEATEFLKNLSTELQSRFKEDKTILSFGGFLARVKETPDLMIRNAGQYMRDCFDYFGKTISDENGEKVTRFSLFDTGTEKHVTIIGGEQVQEEIYKVLCNFSQKGYCDKLIMLHGPNGSAKTSMVESIAFAMHRYSKSEAGAVYRFNWIFPTSKDAMPKAHGESGPIGFTTPKGGQKPTTGDISYASLDDSKIASTLYSEYKENPLFLIPMPQRETLVRDWLAAKQNIPPEKVHIPPHILLSGLSKRNQLIYDQLLKSYDGDLSLVLRHVQIERFFFSRQYRVGIGTVEPQMSIDAYEKQLTMDKNIMNLPTILHNIAFHEAMGPVLEANRGFLEFSDLLKRPLETFKYLLTTVEKGMINLPSSSAMLDIVFMATSNEKHLDAFKTIPDFPSFRGRFELVTVPYLLKSSQEQEIYQRDIETIAKTKVVAPHSLRLLSLWAVLTRLRAPDSENYPDQYRALINRLGPLDKCLLYEGKDLTDNFSSEEKNVLGELRGQIISEWRHTVLYEGRYGASPREISAILYRAAQNPNHATLTPVVIFKELERLIKDQTVYEFLQIEPQGLYHNYEEFITIVKNDFAHTFEEEVATSMMLVEEEQYDVLLKRYIDHIVAFVKREKVLNPITGKMEDPAEELMKEVERIIDMTTDKSNHRELLLRKIAAFRLENPHKKLHINDVFPDVLDRLRRHYFKEREKLVRKNYIAMLAIEAQQTSDLSEKEKQLAETTFAKLQSRFEYDRASVVECLKFIMAYKYESGSGPNHNY